MKKLIIFFACLFILCFSMPTKAQDGCNGDPICIDMVNRYEAYCNEANTDKYGYFVRQCVSYAAWRKVQDGVDNNVIRSWGNAFRWDNWAIYKAHNGVNNIVVNTTPQVGAIIQWNYVQYGEERNRRWGHVGYVEQIIDNNTVKISEYNGVAYEEYSQRNIIYRDENGRASAQFIHFGVGTSPVNALWPKTSGSSGMLIDAPIFTAMDGSYLFKWFGTTSPSTSLINMGFSSWRLDIIKQDNEIFNGILGYVTEASITIPDGATSICIENGKLNWNYRDIDANNGHIYNGKFYFEFGRRYKWRIFNGKEYFEGPEFTCQEPNNIVLNEKLDGKIFLSADYITITPEFETINYQKLKDEEEWWLNLDPYPLKIVLRANTKIRVQQGAHIRPGTRLYSGEIIHDDSESKMFYQSNLLEIPKEIEEVEATLYNIYPNPSRDIVNITFRLEEAGDVKVEILDAMGRKIWEHEAKKQEIGTQKITWQGKNAQRGLCFVHILANGKKEVRKVILIE